MRFSSCLKLVQLSGLFWNQRFIPYGNRWCGFAYSPGLSRMLRFFYLSLNDGVVSSGYNRHRKNVLASVHGTGLFLLQHTTPHINIALPWAWHLLLKLQVRSYAGWRLKLGLPSHGQRTRSNHSNARRNKDLATQEVNKEYMFNISGFAAARKSAFLLKKAKTKQTQKKKVTGTSKKAPAVRTSKKPSVWR